MTEFAHYGIWEQQPAQEHCLEHQPEVDSIARWTANTDTVREFREALYNLAADCAMYPAWQRPCLAFDNATALLQTTAHPTNSTYWSHCSQGEMVRWEEHEEIITEAEEYLPDAVAPYQTLGERTKLLKDQLEYATETVASLTQSIKDRAAADATVRAEREAIEKLQMDKLARLERAIHWALTFPIPQDQSTQFWWRDKLRKLAGMEEGE